MFRAIENLKITLVFMKMTPLLKKSICPLRYSSTARFFFFSFFFSCESKNDTGNFLMKRSEKEENAKLRRGRRYGGLCRRDIHS